MIAKPITAARLRGRIEVVLDFARAAGWRTAENPASKTVIGHMLPLPSEKASVTHQPALPFDRVPALMKALRATEGTDARLLEVIILTVMRSEAVRLARFEEFDLAGRVWAIPMERMKTLGLSVATDVHLSSPKRPCRAILGAGLKRVW